jgi:hypothetical protein
MTVEKIIETNKLLVMIDFANREAEKILARAKELNKEAESLPDEESAEGLKIIKETERLTGRLEDIHIMMNELNRLATKS